MVDAESEAPAVRRYGPLGLTAALVNILVIEFVMWVLLPWVFLLVYLVPLLLLDLGVSAFLRSRQGRLGEVGRGMMIGCLSAPAAVVSFVPLYLLGLGLGAV